MTIPPPAARRWSRTFLVLASVIAVNGSVPGARRPPPAAPVRSAATEAAIATLKQQGAYSSLQAAFERARYEVRPASDPSETSGAFTANNPAHGYQATFTPAGLELAGRDGGKPWRVGVTLTTIGRAGVSESVLASQVAADGARVSVAQRAGGVALTEWFVNATTGLEQGVTIATRPASEGAGPLRLTWQVRGALRPMAGAAGQAVTWVGPSASAVLQYDHLLVRDRNGLTVPSHFETTDTSVAIVVDDARAAYPLTIDPTWTQQAYLKASRPDSTDYLGMSVAVSGDTVVIGASLEDSNAVGVEGDQSNNSVENSGAAYVFTRSGTNWFPQAYLKASNTGADDSFGNSVAVSGDTIVVGANGEDSSAKGVNGSEIDNSASGSGAAYVFTRSGTTWSQQAYLKASNTDADDSFGVYVAVSGDTVVVGAHGEDSNATGVNLNEADNSASGSGAAYVFTRSGTAWSQQAYLKASNTDANDAFGGSVAVSGDTVVVGAEAEDSNATGVNQAQADNSASFSGAAYVFTRSGTTWSQQAYLKASNTGANDRFGRSVAVSGDTIVVGASAEDSNAKGVNGNETNDSAENSGAAYVFTRSGTTWSQQAYLKASNTDSFDSFGRSVAVSGDTVVIGAKDEDSNATGVNGEEGDNSVSASGAAYVFTRSGTTWSQQAYLKASNTGAGDQFGSAVAVSGATFVIGAFLEDSNATNVNGNEADNSVADSGAAYVFLITSDQTITFNALANKTFGDASFAVSATASSGLAVTFASATTAVCTVSGSTVTLVAAGTCTIAADQAGNSNYHAAPQVTRSFTVNKANQAITFNALAGKTFGDAAFSISATAGSGLTVAFSSTTASICTVSSTTVTIVAAGTCTIAADQAGNANYNAAAQVTRSFTVAKAAQSITFGALGNKTLGDAAFTVSATASSSLTVAFTSATTSVCTVSGTTVTLVAIGTCTIAADQAGNGNYNAAAQVTRSFTIACYTLSVGPAALPIGGAGQPYSLTFTLALGTAPITFALTAGSLPGGLSLSTAGVLSGTPTARGAFSISITGTDTNGCQATLAYSLAISRERRLVIGAGGGTPTVRAFNHGSATIVAELNAFAATTASGVSVAQADVDGDGTAEIITGEGAGSAPRVVIYSSTGTPLLSFLAYGSTDTWGLEVAAGDVDGDGVAEIITASGVGGPALIRVFNARTGVMLRQVDRSSLSAAGGMHVGTGDVNGDGRAEILVGAGPTSPPVLQVLDGTTGSLLRQTTVYGTAVGPGVYVAGGDITGDGFADVIASPGAGGGPHVRVFDGVTGAQIPGPLGGFYAYTPLFGGGVRVAASDLDRDGYADLIVGPGPGGGPHIRVLSGATGAELFGFFAFDATFSLGSFVAAAPPMVRMSVDLPQPGATVGGSSLRIAGWALDESATANSGVDAIHAWAYPVAGGAPVFAGAALARGARADIATMFGGEYLGSNFDFTGTLPAGSYDLVVMTRSTLSQTVTNYRIVRITVQ